jgi:hypothetical protein
MGSYFSINRLKIELMIKVKCEACHTTAILGSVAHLRDAVAQLLMVHAHTLGLVQRHECPSQEHLHQTHCLQGRANSANKLGGHLHPGHLHSTPPNL